MIVKGELKFDLAIAYYITLYNIYIYIYIDCHDYKQKKNVHGSKESSN
jgi:hypothetical protein